MRIGLLAPSRRYEDSFLGSAAALFRASGDNLGNFAFIEALWRHLAPDVTILPWDVDPARAREACDILVLAAANQLGAHNDLAEFADQLETIGLPLVVVGLGAQAPDMFTPVALPPGTERWARVIAGLAPTSRPNIGMRGAFSLRVMETLGLGDRAVVMGCPSHFLSDRPDLYAVLKQRFDKGQIDRLCVAAGSRHFAHTHAAERRLVRLVTETGGVYVVQADLEMVQFARGEALAPDAAAAICDFIAPGLPAPWFDRWRQRFAVAYADATSWADAMRSFDFAVGARVHGVMLAMQAGVPGGVIAHDSRTLELCRTTGVPVQLSADISPHFALAELYRLFPLDIAAFAATRERLRRVYVDLLRGCGIEPSARLTAAQALP